LCSCNGLHNDFKGGTATGDPGPVCQTEISTLGAIVQQIDGILITWKYSL